MNVIEKHTKSLLMRININEIKLLYNNSNKSLMAN